MPRLFLLFLLIFIFLPFTHNAQSRKARELKNDFLKSSFLEVDNHILPLQKWEGMSTLNYTFVGEQKFMSAKKWERFVNDLESLTGLKITEKANREEAQVVIYFDELREFASRENVKLPEFDVSHFDHWNSRKHNKNYQLESVSFCLVPSKIKDTQRGVYLLQRSFLKALGLLGELEDESSIFYKHQTKYNSWLSKSDKRIIKLFYLPAVKAGIKQEELEESLVAETDLEELLKQKL